MALAERAFVERSTNAELTGSGANGAPAPKAALPGGRDRSAGRSWRDGAACRGRLDVWYSPEPFEQQVAVAVCRRCPVRAACLAEAFAEESDGSTFGVRGGLTAAQRLSRHGRAVS